MIHRLSHPLAAVLSLMATLVLMGLSSPVAGQAPDPAAKLALELYPFPRHLTLEKLESIKPKPVAAGEVTDLAMLYDAVGDTSPRMAVEIFTFLRHQLSSAKPGIRRFGIWHFSETSWPYPTIVENQPILPSQAQMARDFKKTSADFLFVGNFSGTIEAGSMLITLHALKSDKATSTVISWKDGNFPQAGMDAVKYVAKTCGWSEDDMAKSGILDGGMGKPSWMAMHQSGDGLMRTDHGQFADINNPTSYECSMAARFDPSWDVEKINMLIDKAPWDYRIIRAKYSALDERLNSSKSAMILALALYRIMPEDVRMAGDVSRLVSNAFEDLDSKAVSPADIMEALATEITELASKNPDDWIAHLIAANIWDNFADVVRGAETINKVGQSSIEKHQEWKLKCLRHLIRVRRILGDDYAKLHSYMMNVVMVTRSGPSPRELVEAAYAAEPENPSTFLTVAYYNSIGWGDQRNYVLMIKDAMERHAKHPHAMRKIYNSVGMNFNRIPKFTGETEEQVYKDPNGLGIPVIKQLKKHYPPDGLHLTHVASTQFYQLLSSHGERELANKIYRDNTYYGVHLAVMYEELKAPNKDYPRLLRAAQGVEGAIKNDIARGLDVRRSIVHLKPAEDAMKLASEMINKSKK